MAVTGAVMFLSATANFNAQAAPTRYAGGDISLLPTYEEAGAQYKTHDGEPIPDLLAYLHDSGLNAMRVRLFVNPDDYTGSDKDANACQDLDYILPLCKQIVDHGFKLMLDFHYSDTWADPAKQWTPKSWEGLSDEELYVKIYDYTKSTLETLKGEGIVPDMIQTGNEISYGMLWGPYGTKNPKKCYMNSDANWARLIKLLEEAGKACREVCPDALIVLHNERITQPNALFDFYKRLAVVDYDVIGLSYYPYFHGTLANLNTVLDGLATRQPDKQVMIVETGYPYKWEVPGSNFDHTATWPYSDAGQAKFTQELVDDLLNHPQVTGLFWWWMEYNAYKTSLSGWYNAPLFDSTTGKATAALKALCSFADGSGIDGVYTDMETEADQAVYSIWGIRVNDITKPGMYIRGGRKILVR